MTAMTDEKRAKNRATREVTKAKRAGQKLSTRTLKIQGNKLSKKQAEWLRMAFVEAKWLRNTIVALPSLKDYTKDTPIQVLTKEGKLEQRTLSHLGSQMKQSVAQQVWQDALALSARKQAGHKVGRLKFKSSVNSIDLKQVGVTYKLSGSKLKLQKCPGTLRVNGSEQLDGFELANAKLLRKPDGYYLVVTCFKNRDEIEESFQPGTVVGLDMGVKTHITLSDGSEVNVLVEETERLKRLQRKLKRQQRGSNRYHKTREQIQRVYQKMDCKKDDEANKLVRQLLEHELVFMQDEQLASWRRRNGYVRAGRRLQHSILGRVKSKLKQSERVVVLAKNKPTTQACPCGARNKHQLDQRVYFCSSCGYSAPRDLHAAQNMVRLGAAAAPVRSQELVERVSDWKSSDFRLHAVKREASGSSAQT